jgi:NADPH:quinone reductase-like Zn-dependent oxidoreductase
MRRTMKAMVQDEYGSTEVLEVREIGKPNYRNDEVLVRVLAAGVDRGVSHMMTGLPYPIRLASSGLRTPKNPVLGMDFAGVVEAVGTNVTRFVIGDEVFGSGKGTFAEYARVDENKLASKPKNLSFEQAAAVPTSAVTALRGLREEAMLEYEIEKNR